MQIKKYVPYVFGISLFMFMANKFFLRPWVLENDLLPLFQLIVLSLPNLIEAIMGAFLLTGLFFRLRIRFSGRVGAFSNGLIYLLAVVVAGLYVSLQELKVHNLGGKNVYDPNDLVFSLIGLLIAFGVLSIFGFLEESNINS